MVEDILLKKGINIAELRRRDIKIRLYAYAERNYYSEWVDVALNITNKISC